MPSNIANRLSTDIVKILGGTEEQWVRVAALIDTALNEARLEGAKAVQTKLVSNGYIHNWIYENKGELSPTTFVPSNVWAAINALDPQQVINESVK